MIYLCSRQDLIFFYPVVIFDHFQGIDKVGRIWLVRSDVLCSAHLVEREFSRLEFLPRERERGSIDVGEDDELVVLRKLRKGVTRIRENRPVFDGLTKCRAFLFCGFDLFEVEYLTNESEVWTLTLQVSSETIVGMSENFRVEHRGVLRLECQFDGSKLS